LGGVFRFLFGIQGRTRRRVWWAVTVLAVVAHQTPWWILSSAIWGSDLARTPEYSQPTMGGPVFPLLLSFTLSTLIVGIQTAVGVRRSHDMGRSGVDVVVMNALTIAIAYLVPLPAEETSRMEPYLWAYWFAYLASLGGFFYLIGRLGFPRGAQGPNRYGPSPNGTGDTADVFS
jgi:uncharacterized membrane protein YhaH (DUF805 family)